MLKKAIFAQKELVGMTSDVMIRMENNVLMLDPARSGVYIAKEKDGSLTTIATPAVATVVMTGLDRETAEEELAGIERETDAMGDELYFSYYEEKLMSAAKNPLSPNDMEFRLRQIDELKRNTFLSVDVDRETFVETINRLTPQEAKRSRTIFATDVIGTTLERKTFYEIDSVFRKVDTFQPLLLRFDENEVMRAKGKTIRPFVGSIITKPVPGMVYKGFLVNQPEDNEFRAFVTAKFSHFKIGMHVSEIRFVADDLQEAAEMNHIAEDFLIRSNKASKVNIEFYPVSIDTRILMQMSRIFLDVACSDILRISFTGAPEDPVLFETVGNGEYPDVTVAISPLRPTALISAR